MEITRRPGIADPEGRTIARALGDLGYAEVESVAMGRTIVLEVAGAGEEQVRHRVEEMCRRLLANPVMEDFTITVEDA